MNQSREYIEFAVFFSSNSGKIKFCGAGKFRHLPVVENGEVVAILDIAKCLYDAIARMERAAEKGKAIAAAVEGVEKHWGSSVSGWLTFVFLIALHS